MLILHDNISPHCRKLREWISLSEAQGVDFHCQVTSKVRFMGFYIQKTRPRDPFIHPFFQFVYARERHATAVGFFHV